jgi:hypothetical protein
MHWSARGHGTPERGERASRERRPKVLDRFRDGTLEGHPTPESLVEQEEASQLRLTQPDRAEEDRAERWCQFFW